MSETKIKSIRVERGLTQKKLAEMAEMNEVQLRAIENGRGNPTVKTLERIAIALEVPINDLLEIPEAEDVERLMNGDLTNEEKSVLDENVKKAGKTLGEKLKARRMEMGYTQEQLSKIAGLPVEIYSSYEDSTKAPSYDVLKNISLLLKADVPYFLGYSNLYDPGDATLDRLYDHNKSQIIKYFDELNLIGQGKALEVTADLTKVPDYLKK